MAYSKFSRDASSRKALFRDLVTDLVLYERIQTTEAKAKELRPIAEKLITFAKRGAQAKREAAGTDQEKYADLAYRRHVAAYVRREALYENPDEKSKKKLVKDKDAIQKLFSELAERYQDRSGGYTRILKLGPRRGDAAPMVYLELVDRQ
jgi:large subunit ribosomal protein L17